MAQNEKLSEVDLVRNQGALAAYMRQMEAGGQGAAQPSPQPPVLQFRESVTYLFGSQYLREGIARREWRVR